MISLLFLCLFYILVSSLLFADDDARFQFFFLFLFFLSSHTLFPFELATISVHTQRTYVYYSKRVFTTKANGMNVRKCSTTKKKLYENPRKNISKDLAIILNINMLRIYTLRNKCVKLCSLINGRIRFTGTGRPNWMWLPHSFISINHWWKGQPNEKNLNI